MPEVWDSITRTYVQQEDLSEPAPEPEPEVQRCVSGCGEEAASYRSAIHGTIWYDYCESCQGERRECENCGTECWADDMVWDDYGNYAFCGRGCQREYEGEDDEYVSDDELESSDTVIDTPVLSADNLGFEARYFNPDRGDQLTSVELEFGRNPEGIAETLYNKGLSPARSVGGYHSRSNERENVAYVEYDGSVDNGGEMVISMLGLPGEQETLRLWHTVKVLRDAVHAGDNRLDMRCGCHIHVSALGRDLNSVISTVVAYNHIEDILYRMSAANYKYHRMDNGNEYCGLSPKQIDSKERFQASFGRDRYYGLNVGNYLHYRYDCSCGAGFEHADRCTCDPARFRKATLEFRLFNTTANGAKLHAFIAVCQALTHYGMNRELLSTDLEPMEYSGRRFPTSEVDFYADRILWMLTELPFSAEERNSIRYCLRNCSIAEYLNKGVVDGLVSEEKVQAILHEDEMLTVSDYQVPERVEEAGTQRRRRPSNRHLWVQSSLGDGLMWDTNGCLRNGQTGRFAPNPTPQRVEYAYAFVPGWDVHDDADPEDYPF